MIKHTVCCDVCGLPLPIRRFRTPAGVFECIETARTEQWDTRSIFPHLCKKCALTIDNELLKTKNDILNMAQISKIGR